MDIIKIKQFFKHTADICRTLFTLQSSKNHALYIVQKVRKCRGSQANIKRLTFLVKTKTSGAMTKTKTKTEGFKTKAE